MWVRIPLSLQLNNLKFNTMSEIRKCNCEHTAQDMLHGKGNRMMNPCNKGFRCTVCGKEYSK